MSVRHLNVAIRSHAHAGSLGTINIVIVGGIRSSFLSLPHVGGIISFKLFRVPVGVVEGRIPYILASVVRVTVLQRHNIARGYVAREEIHSMEYELVDSTTILLAIPRLKSRGCSLFFTLRRYLPPGKYFEQWHNIWQRKTLQFELDCHENRCLITEFMRIIRGEYNGSVLIAYIRRVNNCCFKVWMAGHEICIPTVWIRHRFEKKRLWSRQIYKKLDKANERDRRTSLGAAVFWRASLWRRG